ncbi:MAG: Yip1 family protein [Pseudomonadota bacterium]
MASEVPDDIIGRPPSGGMIDRIKRLLITPKAEWPLIDAEPMTVQGIMTGWVLPLAAIGPIAHLIQTLLFPLNILGVVWRPSVPGAVVTAIVSLVLTIVFVYLWSLIIDALAANFGGTKNPIAALKVAAFSATAAWICGIFQVLPLLGLLGILGLYSVYLFWVGLPILMKVPEDKAPTYAVVTILVGIVAGFVIGVISAALVGMMFVMTPGAGTLGGTLGGTLNIPGTNVSVDTSKIDEAGARVEAMGKTLAGKEGAVKMVAPDVLQNMLPAALPGWNRTSIESSGGGAMGMNISEAVGKFEAGDQSFRLKVTDTGAMGALAGIVNAESSKQTATSYEKSSLQDGKMVTEKWDSNSKSGTYSVLVAKRFMIEAEGDAPNIDALKAAVAAVDQGKLEALAQ